MNKQTTFLPLSALLDTPVQDARGESIGQITDILLDRREGRIAYLQFRLNGDAARSNRCLTVPWSTIVTPGESSKQCKLRVGKSTLKILSQSHRYGARRQ